MKPFHIEYNKLINQHNEKGLYELSESISDNLTDKGPGGKYEWYVDLSEEQGKVLRELYENRSQKGTLEDILKKITDEVKEEQQINIKYSKDEFLIQLGSPFIGTKQSIEFKYHIEEKKVNPLEKIRIISYKKKEDIENIVYMLIKFEWELQKKGLEFI